MDKQPLSVRVAQGVAIGASAWLSGGLMYISFLAIPTLLPSSTRTASETTREKSVTQSSRAATQFRTLHTIGRLTQPATTILTSLPFFYLSYRLYHHLPLTLNKVAPANMPPEWKLWLAGGVAVCALAPSTIFLMDPTSQAILKHAEEGKDQDLIGEKGLWTEEKAKAAAARAWEGLGDDTPHATVSREDGQVESLLVRWGFLNAVRACFPLLGTGLGLYALLA